MCHQFIAFLSPCLVLACGEQKLFSNCTLYAEMEHLNICQQFLWLMSWIFSRIHWTKLTFKYRKYKHYNWARPLGHTLHSAPQALYIRHRQFLFTTSCLPTFVLHPGILFMNLQFLVKYFLTTLWQFFVISFNRFYPAHNSTINSRVCY